MPVKYKFTKIMNWLCTTKIIDSKEKNVLLCLLRLSIGFSGCMRTHKITIEQIHDILDDKHFDNEAIKWIVKNCKEYYNEYK